LDVMEMSSASLFPIRDGGFLINTTAGAFDPSQVPAE
jgi:hypothetical protein